jgi:XTP/dITP diphosphohydrolase
LNRRTATRRTNTEPFLSAFSVTGLLAFLGDVPEEERIAVGRVDIGFLPARDAQPFVIEEQTEGRVASEPRGQNGFGWDRVFKPREDHRTYAEVSFEEKSRWDPKCGSSISEVQE